MKPLIVDDQPIIRSGLQRLLGPEMQADIREAANGREALDVSRELRPGVVILDLNSPGMSGLELIGRLKSEEPDLRIEVIRLRHVALRG